MKKGSQKIVSPGNFTQHPEVVECLRDLREYFENRPFIVSDVLDDEKHQYVNLVQKGGGVLGIALVGYTYVLEEMGVRFLRLAGTSAGAINTALLTVIGGKKDKKSTAILEAMSRLNFFDLVDGQKIVKQLIKLFITNKNFSTLSKRAILALIATGVSLVVVCTLLLGLQVYMPALKPWTMLAFILAGMFTLLIMVLLFWVQRLLKRLKVSGYGINPGNFFYDWIKARFRENGVHTVSDLIAKAAEVPDFHLRVDNEAGVETLRGDVTFIASELVSQNKIQFPLMSSLFRDAEHLDELEPAGFVRASMAIPVFFESYYINDIPCETDEIKAEWKRVFHETNPPSTARFVDGGILSNFPIDIFYNQSVEKPRLPSFGIDLDDSKEDEEKNNALRWSLGGYIGRMFNTIRFYYDKAFLIKYHMYQQGIGKVRLSEFNWLNFGVSKDDKIKMFIKGAQAAAEFLKSFDWEDYKKQRVSMHTILTDAKKEKL